MTENFFSLYDTIINSLPGDGLIETVLSGERWALAESSTGSALAMMTEGESIAPMFPKGLTGMDIKTAAQAIKSWNFEEAGLAIAAVNSVYNSPERMQALGCYLPYEKLYTEGIDFRGKTVGMVGHLHGPKNLRQDAKAVYILERSPQDGDYPDSACDYILPNCDIVLITGSSFVNKTLPHLLELCENAYTVLTGPTVPLCPELLEHGIDRLAGLVVTDQDGLRAHVVHGDRGTPFVYGKPFMLEK